MTIARIWILYKPRLYKDLFKRLFQTITPLEIVDAFTVEQRDKEVHSSGRRVDIILLPLDKSGRPDMELLPAPVPYAKIIAFSPTGELGLRRMPGEKHWEEVRPFGLGQLLLELDVQSQGQAA